MRGVWLALLATAEVTAQTQIHIAFTPNAGVLSVDFVATAAAGYVEFGLSNPPTASANTTSFSYKNVGHLHQGLLDFSGAAAGQAGYYRVCSGGISAPLSNCSTVFPVVPNKAGGPEVYAIFGDFGLIDDYISDDLISEAAKGSFDAVLHVGDMAYNFQTNKSSVGNEFMTLMQGYAATKPTMPVAGNHEACPACPAAASLPLSLDNFTEYKARFHSVSKHSNTGNNIFYSFDRGLGSPSAIHFVVFSAEAYLYARTQQFLDNQLSFMKADLAAVDRKATPWVVALVHKDWTMEVEGFTAFAPLLYAAGVDLLFCGHVHHYNRYLPYDSVNKVVDSASVSADGHVYTNPKYMSTIVTGAAGNKELDSKCPGTDPTLSASCTQNYGYGLFTVHNASVVTWTFKTVKGDGPGPANFTDSLTIVRQ